MAELDELAFSAVITIVLPDSDAETTVNVTLLPSDLIAQEDGQLKPLKDCTLRELLQYADNLEAEVWSKYQDQTLVDLVIEGGLEVNIATTKESEGEKDSPAPDLWLQHFILISESRPLSTEVHIDDEDLVSEAEPRQVTSEAEIPPEQPVSAAVEPSVGDDAIAKPAAADPQSKDVAGGKTEPEATVLEDDEATDLSITSDEPKVVATAAIIPEEKLVEETGQKEEILREFRILGRRRPLNHPTWTAVDILMNEPAFRNTQAHALSSLDREVAGILVGPPPEKQPDGRYLVHVSDTIIAKHTRMQGASVTYTPESWRYVNDRLAELYPNDDAMIVGWYHTHPGFGIFLSGMDQFIHQNFFTQIWHIAFVLDPIAHRSGFFCWDRSLTKVDRYEFPWPKWAPNSW